ncbi:methyltransferase domain-containing protein [Candidatus Parcubacteria bacterium]|nr:methyltransferase domain-containing protein [Candidatus Parcubacteria bacterium]
MNHIEQIKQESIKEFGSEVTQDGYRKIAEQGFWNSEEILINKYFKPKSKILDIGCGSGRTTISLHKKGLEVIGVDVTPEMIDTAKKITSSKNLEINLRVGDATHLEFCDNSFDGAIFANNGWVQIPGKENRQKALNEIYRILKPCGYFILTAHQRYYAGYYLFLWIKKWVKLYILKPLGFKIEEIEFGDLFFNRSYTNARQFIHFTSRKEVETQIRNANFQIEDRRTMGNISKEDADLMRGSLSKNFNSYKSPFFYICKKIK